MKEVSLTYIFTYKYYRDGIQKYYHIPSTILFTDRFLAFTGSPLSK